MEWMLEGEILLSNWIESGLLPLSDLCWCQLESDLVMKDSFREPQLENDRECFLQGLYMDFLLQNNPWLRPERTGGGCVLTKISVDPLVTLFGFL